MAAPNSKHKRWVKLRLFDGRPFVRCCFCRRHLTMVSATIEHIQPLSLDGGWERKNLTLSCSNCNSERGVRDYCEFKAEIRKKYKLET